MSSFDHFLGSARGFYFVEKNKNGRKRPELHPVTRRCRTICKPVEGAKSS